MRRALLVITAVMVVAINPSFGQQAEHIDDEVESVERPANTQYLASGLHEFFFGEHYREIWATPVEAPILDLAAFDEGLTPEKKGGGKQTKSLRFISANGAEWTFRSINKDPSKTLPPELRETVAADVVQDQISTAHPYAALVVPPLAQAIGVLHANPRLVIMPDDERLGEFREEFAGLLGMIEERPDDGPDGKPGFAGSKKIISTYDLFERLESKFSEKVHQPTYLRARLLDIFLGDWDRHADQWRWARFKEDGEKFWYPIPRDRDQAFAKFDGLLPAIAERRYVVPQFEGFNKDEPDIFSLTFSGRHLDRLYLNELERDEFMAVAREVQAKLSDEVIEEAIKRLPPPIYALSDAEIIRKLKSRREMIPELASEYYRLKAKTVEIVGRDKGDFVEIDRQDDEHLRIRMFERDRDSGDREGEHVYERSFKASETSEIRLFLLGGDDKVIITGPAANSIPVRIVGGIGNDEIIDRSFGETLVYDTKEGIQLESSTNTKPRLGKVDSVANRHEYEPLIRQEGNMLKPFPFLAVTADDGLFLGGGATIYNYGFRKAPFASRIGFKGNFAFKTNAFRIGFRADFVDAIYGMQFSFEANGAVPREVRNYYGLGNQSSRDASLEDSDFYRVQSEEFMLRPSLVADIGEAATLSVGTAFSRFATDLDDDEARFVLEEIPYGTQVNNLLAVDAAFTVDVRDQLGVGTNGIYLTAGGSITPRAFDNDSTFGNGFADLRFYYSPSPDLTFAVRAKGERIWGEFPYYKAAYLGGPGSLRAFRRERFGGDTSLLGSAELRLYLFRAAIIFPTDIGVFSFGDAGRVWLDDSSEGGWHTDVGGGLWFAPIYRSLTFSIGLANSTEGVRITAGGGFGF